MTTKNIQRDDKGLPTGLIVFTFDDKTTTTFDLNKVPDEIKLQLMAHGASQKIGDSYSSAASQDDPIAFAKMSVDETIKNLYAGSWRSNVGGGAKFSDFAIALSRVTGRTLEDCDAFEETLEKEQKAVWKNKAKVKAEMLKIAAEKAAARAEKAAKAAAANAASGGAEKAEGEAEDDLDFGTAETATESAGKASGEPATA